MEVRKLEDEVARLRAENEQLDHDAGAYGALTAELARYFDGARTAHQAWLRLEAMEGRALAAEEMVKTLRGLADRMSAPFPELAPALEGATAAEVRKSLRARREAFERRMEATVEYLRARAEGML